MTIASTLADLLFLRQQLSEQADAGAGPIEEAAGLFAQGRFDEGVDRIGQQIRETTTDVQRLVLESNELRAMSGSANRWMELESMLNVRGADSVRAAVEALVEVYNAVSDEYEQGLDKPINSGKIVKVLERAGKVFDEHDADATDIIVMSRVPLNSWVCQAANRGKVVDIRGGMAMVKWLSEGTPFRSVAPVAVPVDTLIVIEEPRLGREQAAAYSGLTPTRLYQLNDRGQFGGSKRKPFFVYPHELDAWLDHSRGEK